MSRKRTFVLISLGLICFVLLAAPKRVEEPYVEPNLRVRDANGDAVGRVQSFDTMVTPLGIAGPAVPNIAYELPDGRFIVLVVFSDFIEPANVGVTWYRFDDCTGLPYINTDDIWEGVLNPRTFYTIPYGTTPGRNLALPDELDEPSSNPMEAWWNGEECIAEGTKWLELVEAIDTGIDLDTLFTPPFTLVEDWPKDKEKKE